MRLGTYTPTFAATCLLVSSALTTGAVGAMGPEGTIIEAVPTASFNFERAVETGESMPRLHSLLVSHRGDLVLERYFNGHTATDVENVKSVSKSILSALVGIAIHQGHLQGLGATLGEHFDEELVGAVNANKAGITLENLLTMQAGLRATSNDNYGAWVGSDNWVAFALEQPLDAPPGHHMQYSTGSTHLLSAMLTQATGRSTLEFSREVLAEPLGFELAAWPQDPQGIYFGGNDMELTPRQLLLFGELYLNGGQANGRQVVPAEWVEASLQPHAKSPLGEDRYYGYGWWICALAGYSSPHAWGFGGQFIILVPALELVIVATSSSTPGPERSVHAGQLYELLQRHVIRTIGDTPSALVQAQMATLNR